MATISSIVKMKKKLKFATRYRNICRICGRPRGFMRDFGLCRICFRNMVHRGELPGVRKASW